MANTIAGCETFVGTFTYMAPERIDTTRAPGGYNFSVDVWAIGLMLVECAMGRYPYPDDVVNQMFAYMSKVRCVVLRCVAGCAWLGVRVRV